MTLIVLKAVCNCFIYFFEVLCSWLMTLICRFRPSLATAQTNRFALRLARDSVERGHTVPPSGIHANRTLVVLLLWAVHGGPTRIASGLGADGTSHTPHSECASHAGQHDELQQRQAEQQACENHENDANELETKSLSDGRNQKHSREENGNAYVLVSCFARFCALVSDFSSLLVQT